MMRSGLLAALGLWAASASGLVAQAANAAAGGDADTRALRAEFDSAYHAWDAGHYPDALTRLQRILTVPGTEAFHQQIALLTGERYHTVELTVDGRTPRWSPDGAFAVYEAGEPPDRVTHVVAYENGEVRRVAEIGGWALVFSPDGRSAAYLAEPASAGAPARIVLRDLASGDEREIAAESVTRGLLAFDSEGDLFLIGGTPGQEENDRVRRLTDRSPSDVIGRGAAGPNITSARPLAGPRLLLGIGGSRGGGRGGRGSDGFAVLDVATAVARRFQGTSPAPSADGRYVVFISRADDGNAILLADVTTNAEPRVIMRSDLPLASPALSPDARRVAFQLMPREDWELYIADVDGSSETRVTREIQHDLLPHFLSNDRLFAVMGESRHRRSYVYELSRIPAHAPAPDTDSPASGAGARLLTTGPDVPERERLFHNNTVRTVAPEYDWAPSPDGTKILIVADREGDTVSRERGVYLMDLERRVTREELIRRVDASLARETALRAKGAALFEPIAPAVRDAVAAVSTGRIYGYAHDLFQFDSKFITQPGNLKAVEYLAATLRSWGYEPELQWFDARGVRTANVIAKLPGTVNPGLIYVVSSHFDSVQRGPGADDNSSGTTALLEAARVLKDRPQPASIHFAFFTGEEAGLLGSREYVRRVVANGDSIVGALNNDMIGFANDHRLDNTIRYSNDGIRDAQHAAAFLFTNLITYDAKYYRSTDAAAYYEAYGDIVGGIGSYPILGSPHYHQPHDVLETINQQLVAEVSKTTVATLMLLASSPARLKDLRVVSRTGDAAEVAWTPAGEADVREYIVTWGPPAEPSRRNIRVTEPRASLTGVSAGDVIRVKAVNASGIESWDWARTEVR